MNMEDSKVFEESDDDEFDPEFIHFIESFKKNCEYYNMLIDILNIIV